VSHLRSGQAAIVPPRLRPTSAATPTTSRSSWTEMDHLANAKRSQGRSCRVSPRL